MHVVGGVVGVIEKLLLCDAQQANKNTHSGFHEPKMAKSRKIALGGKKNSSAGFALFLVKSRPKHLEMAPNMQLMKLPY